MPSLPSRRAGPPRGVPQRACRGGQPAGATRWLQMPPEVSQYSGLAGVAGWSRALQNTDNVNNVPADVFLDAIPFEIQFTGAMLLLPPRCCHRARQCAGRDTHCTGLASLNLDGNHLGEGGGRALAKTTRLNTTVTSLSLRSHDLGEGGGRAMAATLRLTSFECCWNGLGAGGRRAGVCRDTAPHKVLAWC